MIARTPIRTVGKSWRAALLAAALATTLAGCAGKWGFPYKADLQQGNWVTQEQISLLQPGMTREQVRFALGSPTLTSVLHADRWDYPYYFKPGYGKPEERQFTVWFEHDQLVRWSGDEQPTLEPFQLEKAPQQAATGAKPSGDASSEPDEAAAGEQADTRQGPVLNAPQSLPPADNPAARPGTAEPLR